MIIRPVTPSAGTFCKTAYSTGTCTVQLLSGLKNSLDFGSWIDVATPAWTVASSDGSASARLYTTTEEYEIYENSYAITAASTDEVCVFRIMLDSSQAIHDPILSHYLKITYLTSEWKATYQRLPQMTTTEIQVTLQASTTSATPISFAWPMVHAEAYRGAYRIWQPEFFVTCRTPTQALGTWASTVIDAGVEKDGGSAASATLLPRRCLFHYQHLASLNNLPNIEAAVDFLKRYDLVITLGLGQNTTDDFEVIRRLQQEYGVRTFAYTDGAGSTSVNALSTVMDQLAAESTAWAGVFLDLWSPAFDARVDKNAIIDYAHNLGWAFFPNIGVRSGISWLAGTSENSVLYPEPTHLTTGDVALIESFYFRSDGLPAGYAPGEYSWGETYSLNWANFVTLAHRKGVKVAGLTYASTAAGLDSQAEQQHALIAATIIGLDYLDYNDTLAGQAIHFQSWPDLRPGSCYLSEPMVTAFDARWERQTDAGLLWLEVCSSEVRRSGIRRRGTAPAVQITGIDRTRFTADRVTLSLQGRPSWESTWRDLPDSVHDGMIVAHELPFYRLSAILETLP